jgi:hypothetical protein
MSSIMRRVALASIIFFSVTSGASAFRISINDISMPVDCPRPLPIGGVCVFPFSVGNADWSAFGSVITHNFGGVAGDLILTDFHFITRAPVPGEAGPGRTLTIEVIARYALAFPFAFSASETLDGRFGPAPVITIAALGPAAVVPGAGGPARGSLASVTHQLDFTELPGLLALKDSAAGSLETFSKAGGIFFGIPNNAPVAEAQFDTTYFFRLAPGSPIDTEILLPNSAVGKWAVIPEPGTLAFFICGLVVLIAVRLGRLTGAQHDMQTQYAVQASRAQLRT